MSNVEAAEALRMEAQIEILDDAVAEVFQLMMGVACLPNPPASETGDPVAAKSGVTAVVGLAGSLSGACVLRMREPAALKLAAFMVGEPMAKFDRTVKDALGEACNMLAGTWKGRLTGFASTCMLSVPAVISGSNYEFHLPQPAFHLLRSYAFDDCAFTFCIDCMGL